MVEIVVVVLRSRVALAIDDSVKNCSSEQRNISRRKKQDKSALLLKVRNFLDFIF